MQPNTFIAKWRANSRNERAAAQEHFLDLCALLGEPTPNSDPTGAAYAFEKGATKASGGEGWADVWRRGRFAWEYKGKHKNLDAAHRQLLQYAGALENPPLLVTCDIEHITIRTNWTNAVSERHEVLLEEVADPARLALLKAVFADPERLRPGTTRAALTAKAAADFAELAGRLRSRGNDPQMVAHFVNRLVFCLFADDVNLLPTGLFERMLDVARKSPARFQNYVARLFAAMAERGGEVDFTPVAWFNGGLFDDATALPLEADDISLLQRAAALDWAEIDPSILGTLFERGLDPGKRSQLGAHYTSREMIELLIEPIVRRPLLAEWGKVHVQISNALKANATAKPSSKVKRDPLRQAETLFRGFLDRLRAFRVLDPACGSGNFLYLALIALKNVEHQAMVEAEALGLQREFPQVGPEAVLGLEVNPYAAELARISVWIGHIQWARRHGFPAPSDPVLRTLNTIECRDALLDLDGGEAPWPKSDVIIGNPPFLGAKEMRGTLIADYLSVLRNAYAEKVSGRCDLVMYWFYRGMELLDKDLVKAIGLVATNKVRKGENSKLFSRYKNLRINEGWSDLRWVLAGAAVRVSVVCMDRDRFLGQQSYLDGNAVCNITPELTAEGSVKLLPAVALLENRGVAFVGGQKDGPFEIPAEDARRMLLAPLNPNGRTNADVIRPWCNGMDLARRGSGTWIIDFGERSLENAQFYELPFAHVEKHVAPIRARNNDKFRRAVWWQHGRPASKAKSAIGTNPEMIVTPLTSKHRWFVLLSSKQFPDNSVVVFARNDFIMLGLLSSRFSVLWSKKMGNFMGVGNDSRYTPSTAFDTYPFPSSLTPNVLVSERTASPHGLAISMAAKRLNELRQLWINPPDLTKSVRAIAEGYPDTVRPVDDAAAIILKRRTMTKLYNERPAWLLNAHRILDAAVADAYGWPADLSDDEVLGRLLALNHERASIGRD